MVLLTSISVWCSTYGQPYSILRRFEKQILEVYINFVTYIVRNALRCFIFNIILRTLFFVFFLNYLKL
jgi:hypothetical protein